RASRRSLPVLRSRHRGKPPLTPCIALSQTAHPLERLSFPTRRSSDLKQTGLPAFLSSVRIAWWSQRGLSLAGPTQAEARGHLKGDRKSTRLNSSHDSSSYAVNCLNKNTPVRLFRPSLRCVPVPIGSPR